MYRRQFLKVMLGGGLLASGAACTERRTPPKPLKLDYHYVIDDLGIAHAPEFHTRIVANSGKALPNGFVWLGAPDGGGVIQRDDGGWIYVCNSELGHDRGGVAALVFNAQAEVIDAYSLLGDSNYNCGGTVTPWRTWLSCEERKRGVVWECDPLTRKAAQPALGLGVFTHESAAIDPRNQVVYLTEDLIDSGFYRYLPHSVSSDGRYDLQKGQLQACLWDSQSKQVQWQSIDDPSANSKPTRYQNRITPFAGGEGICYFNGLVYFNTKNDNRIWKYDIQAQRLEMIYQASAKDQLHSADAMTSTPDGSIWVAEDGDDMQIVALSRNGRQKVLLQIQGQDDSEVTGLAFTADYRRLYFNSQRGPSSRRNSAAHGITYEIEGDFLAWMGE